MKANIDSILSSVLQNINRRVIRGIQDQKEISLLQALNKYDELLTCNKCNGKEKEQIEQLIQDIKYQCPDICNFSTRIVNTQSQRPNLAPQSDNVLFRFQLPSKYAKTLFVLPYEQIIFNYYDADNNPEDGFKITEIGKSQWLYISGNEAIKDLYVTKNSKIEGGFNIPYRIVHSDDIPHIGIFNEDKFKELYKDYKPRLYHFNDQCNNVDNETIISKSECAIKPKIDCTKQSNDLDLDKDKNYVEFSKLKNDKSGFEYVRLEFNNLCCKTSSHFKIKVKDKNWYKDLYADEDATITTEYIAQWEELPNCCAESKPLIYSPQINRSPNISDNTIIFKLSTGLNKNKFNLSINDIIHDYIDYNNDEYDKIHIQSKRFDNVKREYNISKSEFNNYEVFWFVNQNLLVDNKLKELIVVDDIIDDLLFLDKKENYLVFQKFDKKQNKFITYNIKYKKYTNDELVEILRVKVQDNNKIYPLWSNEATITLQGKIPSKSNICTNDKIKKLIFVK